MDDDRVTVNRTEEEVFSIATIASFEGKPITNNHPTEDVRPDNIASYLRGVSSNVRRGTGNESDLLLSDLIVYDPNLISLIEAGKKEISCGYDCVYAPVNDQYEQQQIRGNHIAVVESGRAGPRVKIKDSQIKGAKKMPKIDKNTLLGKILKAFSVDAEPEEIAAAHALMTKDGDPEKEPAKDAEPADEMLTTLKAIVTRLEALEAKETAQQDAKPEPDALDALEEELKGETKDEDAEESVTVPAESMNDEEAEEEKEKTADSNAGILASIKAMKPVIASMTNPVDRKKASDALAKAMRDQMPKPSVKPKADAYKAMATPKKSKDAKAPADQTEFGKNCASRNPHKQGGK